MNKDTFNASNWLMPKMAKIFEEKGLNWWKFLCGGTCQKKTHQDFKTGVWKNKLECEQAMVNSIAFSFRISGMKLVSRQEFLKVFREYVFSKYKPDEIKLHNMIFRNVLIK